MKIRRVSAVRAAVQAAAPLAVAAMALPWLSTACEAAQAGALLFAQAAPNVGTAKGEAPARYYVMELLVVLVLFGAALYAVCRTSRRS